MFKRILVPIDGSETAKRGLSTAVRLAKEAGGRIRLVHVVEVGPLMLVPEAGVYTAGVFEAMSDSGRKLLARAEAEVAKKGCKVDTVLVENRVGQVADAIVEQAGTWRADVIALGTHGRRGVGRLMMGSDAEQVVRLATVPVLLINAGEAGQPSRGGPARGGRRQAARRAAPRPA
jgi:nucleotide-binding universal stress UspA family protein